METKRSLPEMFQICQKTNVEMAKGKSASLFSFEAIFKRADSRSGGELTQRVNSGDLSFQQVESLIDREWPSIL